MRAKPWLLGLLGAIACGGPPPEARPTPIPEAWKTDTGSAFFIQMADTQFGMWSKPGIFSYLGWPWNEDSFVRETHDMEKAIAHASRLRPLFVIMCGDLVNTPGHAGQSAEFARIADQLDEGVPFYVVAPLSTIDPSLASGAEIPIEERPAAEVTEWFGRRTAPEGVDGYNPAFDVTPAELVTSIITEVGRIERPDTSGVEEALRRGGVPLSATEAR